MKHLQAPVILSRRRRIPVNNRRSFTTFRMTLYCRFRQGMLLSTAILAACTLEPDYHRPNLPVPDAWPATQQPVAEASIDAIGWKEFFRSSDLQAVIATALENNRDLRIAMLNVEAARAQYRIQRSFIFPDVTAEGRATRQGVPEALSATGKDEIANQVQANLATAFELDLFGRLRSLSNAELETYFATEAAQRAARITLIAEVANTYLQWLADREILALSEETLKAQEQSRTLIAASLSGGVATRLDLAQVETAVESARANRERYRRLVEQDRNALFLLMGKHDPAILPDNATLAKVRLTESLPVGLPSTVLLRRPDIQQAEHQLQAANALIGAARAAFFPSINLTGSYGYASTELSNLFSGGAAGAWSFVPTVSLPLFAGGRNVAALESSKAQRDIAVAQYERAVQQAFREVADQFSATTTLESQLSAQRALVRASQQAYDTANARYKAGIDRFLNVLDAQRSLFSAQQDAIDVTRQRLSVQIVLYKALGGGLKR
jgi:outer membrane protein, multidrug efflux system